MKRFLAAAAMAAMPATTGLVPGTRRLQHGGRRGLVPRITSGA